MAYCPKPTQGIRVFCSADPCATGLGAPCGPLQTRGVLQQSFNNDAEGCDWNFTTDFWTADDETHRQPLAGLQPAQQRRLGAQPRRLGARNRDESPVARIDCSNPTPAGQGGWVYTVAEPSSPVRMVPPSRRPCQFLQPLPAHRVRTHAVGQENTRQQSSLSWAPDCRSPLVGPEVVMDKRPYYASPDRFKVGQVQGNSWWPMNCSMPLVEPDSAWDESAATRQVAAVLYSQHVAFPSPPRQEPLHMQYVRPADVSHQARPEKERDCCVPLNKHRSCTVDMNSCLDPPIEGDLSVEADFRQIHSNPESIRFPSPPMSKATSTMSLWDILG
mmetsp:Transcript_153365/g.278705  ORF Transcript_153365/g.278705 Transcript_153365/m.278705 type:complete len:330 (-) Transcript_153365:63-1052(-)